MSTLKTRVKLGTVLFAVFFGVMVLDALFSIDIGFGCIAAIAAGMGLYEFYNIAAKCGFRPFRISGIGIGIWLFASYWISIHGEIGLESNFFRKDIALVLIFLLLLLQAVARGTKDAIKNISVTIFGIFYIPFLLSFAIALRHFPNGTCVVIMTLLVSKFGDIGGYLLGRKFGKHKLARSVSPNKTVEGACFSIIFSILVAVIFNCIPQTRVISLPWSVLFGAVVGAFAISGDLAESLIKRDANVKDAGDLVPSFGGVLDVIDCLLVSMPVAYYFFIFFNLV
ncbi:MAG: phosphatidate cytidylyltransferase [Candidatus Kuenenia sp.]|nr:phosphatidate cytidylyltransferase [Candidatus Kuenenia hertensis]